MTKLNKDVKNIINDFIVGDKKYWTSKYNNTLDSINFYNKWVLDSMDDTTYNDDYLLEMDEWENENTILVGNIVLYIIREQKYINGEKTL